MKHIIKHGTSQPSTRDIDPFQLGWCTSTKKLYINDEGTIRTVSSTVLLEENVLLTSKGESINKNDNFIVIAETSDFLKITFTYNCPENKVNLKIQPLDNRSFTLQNAITHKEYNTSSGYKSETNFAQLQLDSLDFDIGTFNDAIDKNIYFELFFTIRGYDYKIDFHSADENETSISTICTISRTVSQ